MKSSTLFCRARARSSAAFWSPALAQGVYALVALVWLIPDRRIEKALAGQ